MTTGIKNNTRNAIGRSEVGGVSADVMLSVAEASGRARAAKSTAGIKNNTRNAMGRSEVGGVSADVMLSVAEASGRARAAKKATRVYFYIPASPLMLFIK